LSLQPSVYALVATRNPPVNETGEPRGVVVEGSEVQTDPQTVGLQQRIAQSVITASLSEIACY
jgi:hypothetical protein